MTSLSDLNLYFRSWLESYDNRILRTTKQTPKQRFEAQTGHIRYLTAEQIQEIFLWEEERKVRKTSIVEIEGSSYDVDPGLRGKRIQVRYNPFDLSLIQVWLNGIRYADAKPANLRNQRHSKLPEEQRDERELPLSNYLERLRQEQEEQKQKQLENISFIQLQEKKERGDTKC